MGLCKCNRKKVTNLFCYHHRVNVCEHCLVANHPSCVVQNYLSWLQDSDYDPNCSLCATELGQGEVECVRLLCLHVFHWECLDKWAQGYPANTAPAGFKCPICQDRIFPSKNNVSPIAETLRQKMQTTNWARAGLGLPLMNIAQSSSASSGPSVHAQHSETLNGQGPVKETWRGNASSAPPHAQHETAVAMDGSQQQPFVHQEEANIMSVRKAVGSSADVPSDLLAPGQDADLGENKYKRRSAGEWFARWIRSRSSRGAPDPLSSYKRTFLILVIVLIAVMTVITVLTRVSRDRSGDDDPFLDPVGNPNIRVAGMQE